VSKLQKKNVSVENKVTASVQLVVCGYLGVGIASLPPLTMVWGVGGQGRKNNESGDNECRVWKMWSVENEKV